MAYTAKRSHLMCYESITSSESTLRLLHMSPKNENTPHCQGIQIEQLFNSMRSSITNRWVVGAGGAARNGRVFVFDDNLLKCAGEFSKRIQLRNARCTRRQRLKLIYKPLQYSRRTVCKYSTNYNINNNNINNNNNNNYKKHSTCQRKFAP